MSDWIKFLLTQKDHLSKAVKENDFKKIKKIIESDKDLLEYQYEENSEQTLLFYAISSGASDKTIELLIDLGANVQATLSTNGYKPLHYAVNNKCEQIVTKILSHDEQYKNGLALFDNALHILLKNNSEEHNILEHAKLLIEKGVDVNSLDLDNKTPLYLAAEKKFRNIVNIIFQTVNTIYIDIECNGITARQLLEKNNIEDTNLPKPLNHTSLLSINNKSDFVNVTEDTYSLLERSCKLGFSNAVSHLLEELKYTNPYLDDLIMCAMYRRHFDVIKILVDYYIKCQNKIQPDIIDYLIKLSNLGKRKDYSSCLDEIIKKWEKCENLMDIDSALHTAVLVADTDLTEKLLKLGASLVATNLYGIMPIDNIDARLLRRHLNRCIECVDFYKNIDRNDFLINVNFKTLIAPKDRTDKKNHKKKSVTHSDVKSTHSEKNGGEYAANEVVISVNNEHGDDNGSSTSDTSSNINKSFPLNDSNTQSASHTHNNKYYIGDTNVPNISVIVALSESSKLNELLLHPVIMTYLTMKWYMYRWNFYANAAFYTLYFLSLGTYTFCLYSNFDSSDRDTGAYKTVGRVAYYPFVVTAVYLMGRELFQFCVSPRTYVTNIQNYLEVTLVILTFLILLLDLPIDSKDTEKQEQAQATRRELSAVSILLSAFGFVLMIGQHPYFSTNIEILKKVLTNFVFFLLWYAILIIAFVFSFYLLFSHSNKDDMNNISFNNFSQSMLKTIIMVTGEYDSESIPFESVLSKIIFCLFIVMISIILMNLLNGLAVSDIGEIKRDAEILGLTSRIQYIEFTENVSIMKNIYGMLRKVLKFLPLIDYELLNNYKIKVSINNKGKIHLPYNKNIYLDTRTVRTMKRIINRIKTTSENILKGTVFENFEDSTSNLEQHDMEHNRRNHLNTGRIRHRSNDSDF